MITTVVLPAVRRGDMGTDRLKAFGAIERRFVWQARTAVIVVALTGFYMAWRLDLWDRFRHATFWWMHTMVLVWLLFAIMLFVVEPLMLHRHFPALAQRRPDAAFAWLHRAHWVLLVLSVLTILGAVAGVAGGSIF
jgi:uncharacterized membrane protein